MKNHLIVLLSAVGIILAGCNKKEDDSPEPPIDEVQINKMADVGGRVAWYKGTSHSKILFDKITNSETKDMDLFVMDGDGTNTQCLTCGIPEITGRFVGQPEWHPDGIHCIVQVENSNSNHTRHNHMAFGINNDLWLLNTQTLTAEKIFETDLNHAALHAHFNDDGSKLFFSNRTATGEVIPALVGVTPGGENHWDGWAMNIADFDISKIGSDKLSNHVLLKPNGEGFYETHQINDKLTFSFTPNGAAYVDDSYQSDLDGNNVVNLINQPTSWEEHASFSPSKTHFIFISSRHDISWSYPGSTPATINTELFIQNASTGEIEQLTTFNEDAGDFRVLTSDFEWNKEGNRVIFLVARVHDTNPDLDINEIWEITFPESK